MMTLLGNGREEHNVTNLTLREVELSCSRIILAKGRGDFLRSDMATVRKVKLKAPYRHEDINDRKGNCKRFCSIRNKMYSNRTEKYC